MDSFKAEVLTRLDDHEARHNRTESAIQSIHETLNFMRNWMDNHSEFMARRFDEQARDFKAHVDLRHEQTLSFFQVIRDELRERGATLRELGATSREHEGTLREQGAAIRELGNILRQHSEVLRTHSEALQNLTVEQRAQGDLLRNIDSRLERLEMKAG